MKKYFAALAATQVTRQFKQGSIILYQGEVPRSASLLQSGVVRVFSISPQGEDQIVTLHIEGEFFPSSWIFEKSKSTLFFYEALTDCEVTFMPRRDFLNYMDSDQERRSTLLDYFTTNYAASLIRINALEQPKARDKLLYTLYFLTQRYNKRPAEVTNIEIPLSLTHQHFASMVGLTRETTAVELSKLKKEGVIRYRQQRYTIKLPRLLELIGEDSFRGISISDR